MSRRTVITTDGSCRTILSRFDTLYPTYVRSETSLELEARVTDDDGPSANIKALAGIIECTETGEVLS